MPKLTTEEIEARELRDLGDNFYLDPTTGEIIESVEEPFRVTDMDSADWVMRKLQELDADLVRETALLEARAKPIQTRINTITRHRQYLEQRFREELKAFAALQLQAINASAKKPVQFVDTSYGRLQFRKGCAKVVVREGYLELAIRWLSKQLPQALKQEVLPSVLKEHLTSLPSTFFEAKEPEESFSISTGVKVEKPGKG